MLSWFQEAQRLLFSTLAALRVRCECVNDRNILTSASGAATINKMRVAITGRLCWRSTCTAFAWKAYFHSKFATSVQTIQVAYFNIARFAEPSVSLERTSVILRTS